MELKHPPVSIVTINRNNAAGLEKTMDSVFMQSNKDYQYIVIDGASTDNSIDIIKEQQHRIAYWISEPDKGIYNAMNKGIRQANGEYLLFLNSGDTLSDDSILQQLAATGYQEDIVYGNILYEGDTAPMRMPDTIALHTFLGPSIGHSAAFMRSTLFKQHGLYNEDNRMVSDWEFFIKAFIIGGCSYRHIDKLFTIYQRGGISVSPEHGKRQLAERDAALKRLFPAFYDLIRENAALKEKLTVYEQSRFIQLLKKWQDSGLNRFKNKYFRPKSR